MHLSGGVRRWAVRRGQIAQLVRALRSHRRGRGFESLSAHQRENPSGARLRKGFFVRAQPRVDAGGGQHIQWSWLLGLLGGGGGGDPADGTPQAVLAGRAGLVPEDPASGTL